MTNSQAAKRRYDIIHTLILLLAAFIWGSAFVAQALGADYVGPLTFLALRSVIGFAALLLFLIFRRAVVKHALRGSGMENALPTPTRKTVVAGGFVCGTILFVASLLQQIGVAYTTTAKAGFITTMYVVLVPILSIFIGKFPARKILFCVALEVVGLYFLSMSGAERLSFGDGMILLCALCFAFQIMAVNYFVERMDGVLLSCAQFLTVTVYSLIGMFLFEAPTVTQIIPAMPSILYAGLLSSGVAYTLQIVGQKGLNPTIASLAMCMESVFSALTGFVILHQVLTGRELFGCALMFAAILLSQIGPS